MKRVSVPSRGILFPNLYGCTFQAAIRKANVSVPSRGILFPNDFQAFYQRHWSYVSVPSRGILFPNEFIIVRCCGKYLGFPSPLGASYFQMLPARARYFAGFSDSFAWQIIFLYIFLISNIHNLLQMQYLCGARKNYKLYQYYLNSNFTF